MGARSRERKLDRSQCRSRRTGEGGRNQKSEIRDATYRRTSAQHRSKTRHNNDKDEGKGKDRGGRGGKRERREKGESSVLVGHAGPCGQVRHPHFPPPSPFGPIRSW
jgi:hypothetical protein